MSDSFSTKPIFNQIRLSFGQTHLNFEEVRNGEFLIPSDEFPDAPFLLNAPLRLNVTAPTAGQPNTGAVLYRSAFAPIGGQRGTTTESINGFIGQAIVAGFSPLGVDVYNFPQRRVNNTYQFADELTRRLKKHSFVFGIDTRRTDLNSDLPRLARPLVTFNGTPRLVFENGAFRFPTANDPNPIIRPEDLVSLGAASNFLVTFNVDRPDSKAALRFYQFNIYGQDAWRISPKLSLSYGLRYEYNTPVSEVNRLIERTFTDERLRFAPGLQQFIGGRTRLYEPDGNNFAPRLGVSYSPNLFGTTRTSVFRVGYGIFYDQILGAVVSQSRNVFPTFLTTNFGGINVIGESFLGYLNPTRPERGVSTPTGEFISLRAPGTINTLNPAINFTDLFDYLRTFFPNAINATLPSANLKMPMAHHYSFVYEQQLNSHYTVSIGYIGTSAENLLRFTTPNLGPSLTVAPTGQQIFPAQTETSLIPFPIEPVCNYFRQSAARLAGSRKSESSFHSF
ncbi:MAG: TonB-dependent receptor [Pyrinomonadaceae bacterium]|nr:TonB-dependent receptor [Pyrinomonadaceae bacterium]